MVDDLIENYNYINLK